MKLIRFRVTKFRSVKDSGWIEADNVTALIGTNESGKTNLLLPLWKLNPASDGAIEPMRDYPRSEYNEIRDSQQKPVFIEAYFETSPALSTKLEKLTGYSTEQLSIVSISRDYDGKYFIRFPDAHPLRELKGDEISNLLQAAKVELDSLQPMASEETFKPKILATIKSCTEGISENIGAAEIEKITSEIAATLPDKQAKTSVLIPRCNRLLDEMREKIQLLQHTSAEDSQEAVDAVLKAMPSFVYYSNYGNLDSEIYLPHVIDNFTRPDLGQKDAAKVRTLKVLFDFVRLKPEEIRDLGKDLQPGDKGTQEQIQALSDKKKEREILLQSASTKLTREFRTWWKQGQYVFDLQADGNHFRIWVSDDKRPEKVELDGRSTGLQWFLSFFLVFLVERQEQHAGAILLLDEPGLSLHPLAQKDLSEFFESLAETNQLLYTTHSPFLVDADRLDRVKAVYVDKSGLTAVSNDLRAGERERAQANSIYPVHAALGLSVSDVLLQGCQAVIVEGQSDQHYLSSIKTFLIARKLINPFKEIVFIPGKGARSIKAIASIITGTMSELPFIILDSDAEGLVVQKELLKELYKSNPSKVLMVETFTSLASSEIEDLLPQKVIAELASKIFKGPEEDFSESELQGAPIVPQMEKYISDNNLAVPMAWKVELAKKAKIWLIKQGHTISDNDPIIKVWQKLFSSMMEEADRAHMLKVVGSN